jgi:hypothetical protein
MASKYLILLKVKIAKMSLLDFFDSLVIRLEKVIEKFKQISASVPTHMVDEYNETIERCCQCIKQAKEFVWKINQGTGSISLNDMDEALWVQAPTSQDTDD